MMTARKRKKLKLLARLVQAESRKSLAAIIKQLDKKARTCHNEPPHRD